MSDQLGAEAAIYTAHKSHTRQISVTPVGFEPVIPAITRLQTYASDRTVTGMLCGIKIVVEMPDWKDETALRTVARNVQNSCMTRARRANFHSV